jgi:hypothetical protein
MAWKWMHLHSHLAKTAFRFGVGPYHKVNIHSVPQKFGGQVFKVLLTAAPSIIVIDEKNLHRLVCPEQFTFSGCLVSVRTGNHRRPLDAIGTDVK